MLDGAERMLNGTPSHLHYLRMPGDPVRIGIDSIGGIEAPDEALLGANTLRFEGASTAAFRWRCVDHAFVFAHDLFARK
jgi:hypothetical protein